MGRLILILLVFLFGVGADAGVPIWDLQFPQHQHWDVAMSDRLGEEYRIEWTHGEETMKAWSERVTYSFTPAEPAYFPLLTNRMFSAVSQGCPRFRSEKIVDEPQKVIHVWSDEGCGEGGRYQGITRFDYYGGGILVLQYTHKPDESRASFPYWKEAVTRAAPGY